MLKYYVMVGAFFCVASWLPSAKANQDLCPKGYMLGAFKLACMRFSYDELGWNDAAMACRATNDSLLVLDTIKDIVGFRTLRAQFYEWRKVPVWLGGKNYDGIWRWGSGSKIGMPILLSNYKRGRPRFQLDKNHPKLVCLQQLGFPDLTWAEDYCSTKKRYMCERPISKY